MEYKDDERPLLNGHGTGQLKRVDVPATLLPAVLSHLGLENRPMMKGDQAVAALRDEKSSVRVAAVRSLGERREVSSLPFLVPALHDPAWEVRAAAVWALSAFGEHAPVEALIEALADADGTVRAAALRVLSNMRGQVPPEILARMLHDDDWQVREAVTLTVEELGEIEVLGDRYQLQGSIGRGGMATIYRGRDRRMERVVAIKVLRDIYSTDVKFVTRFQREAKAASALQHSNIVQVFDYGQTDGNYFIVMELIEGTDLRRYLRSRGVLDVNRAIIIAHDVALGLGAAHRRGIVHRDVKPQNVLVGRDGSIKLTDFGIASVYMDINAERLTTTGMTLGTVQYYAPEQAQGEIVSPAADVYALGIVMYEMLTGRTPFDGDTPVAVAMRHIQDAPVPPGQYNPGIPAALEEIILRCLEKVPEMRFRDGSQLARALESLGDAEIGGTMPFPPGQTPASTPVTQIPSRVPVSSPNTMMPTSASAGRNSPGAYLPSNWQAKGQQPVYPDQQISAPPGSPPEPGTTRSFQRGTTPRDRRDWRVATLVKVLILLATLLLLSFSIYVTAELGFIKLPFLNNGGAMPTQTSTYATVPNLFNDDYATALKAANDAGFQLRVNGYTPPATPPASYVVTQQSPNKNSDYPRGSTIEVAMHSRMTTVPLIPHDSTVETAQQLLLAQGLNVTIKDAGPDATLPLNTVVKVNPPSGTSIAMGSNVTLDVKNYTAGSPVVTPTPSPSPTHSVKTGRYDFMRLNGYVI